VYVVAASDVIASSCAVAASCPRRGRALRLDESTEELGAGGGACNPSLNGLN